MFHVKHFSEITLLKILLIKKSTKVKKYFFKNQQLKRKIVSRETIQNIFLN